MYVQNIVEELQTMLVEEKTSGDLRTKRLLDERARLEESIRELHKNSELEQRKNYENLQTAKQKKAEVENIRIKLDQGMIFLLSVGVSRTHCGRSSDSSLGPNKNIEKSLQKLVRGKIWRKCMRM